MKSLIRLIVISIFFSFTLTACYYDKEDVLYRAECDTVNVTYTKSIIPIMVANCNACHFTGAIATNNVVTNNYNDLITVVNNGKLWTSLTWTSTYNMPKGSNKLSNCDLAKIKKWIDGGALNN